ncbi:unnamed protein product [Ectocarpus sp. 12 AP-2014]
MEEQAEREARLAAEAEGSAKREAEAREAARLEALGWEEKFQALQREREQEAQRAREEMERAVEEAREFERSKALALRAAEARGLTGCCSADEHPLEGANVSYEDVDDREGRQWWQCVFCSPDVSFGDDDRLSSPGDDDDVEASVSSMKPEMWIKSSGNSASTRSMSRPAKGDVCTVS